MGQVKTYEEYYNDPSIADFDHEKKERYVIKMQIADEISGLSFKERKKRNEIMYQELTAEYEKRTGKKLNLNRVPSIDNYNEDNNNPNDQILETDETWP